jgi:hypothetical protein
VQESQGLATGREVFWSRVGSEVVLWGNGRLGAHMTAKAGSVWDVGRSREAEALIVDKGVECKHKEQQGRETSLQTSKH